MEEGETSNEKVIKKKSDHEIFSSVMLRFDRFRDFRLTFTIPFLIRSPLRIGEHDDGTRQLVTGPRGVLLSPEPIVTNESKTDLLREVLIVQEPSCQSVWTIWVVGIRQVDWCAECRPVTQKEIPSRLVV